MAYVKLTLFRAPQGPWMKRALSCPPTAGHCVPSPAPCRPAGPDWGMARGASRIAAMALGRRDGAGDACGVLTLVARHIDPDVSGRRRLRESPWLLRSIRLRAEQLDTKMHRWSGPTRARTKFRGSHETPPAVESVGRVRESHRSIVGRRGLGPQPSARLSWLRPGPHRHGGRLLHLSSLRECTRFLTIGSAAHAERTRFRQFQPIRVPQVDGQMTGAWPVPSCRFGRGDRSAQRIGPRSTHAAAPAALPGSPLRPSAATIEDCSSSLVPSSPPERSPEPADITCAERGTPLPWPSRRCRWWA
jgi:hypothetical protein